MTDANEELVRQGYAAFASGDMETLGSLYAPDAVHVATGSSPVAGSTAGSTQYSSTTARSSS